MDYEQRYNDALARAKEQLDGANVFDYDNEQIAHDIRNTVYNIFPELAESEDEKIRKELIAVINDLVLPDEQQSRFIAWLEKQREQRPTEWSEEDESSFLSALWCCKKVASIAKDENEMGTIWCAERWLKSLKSRL